jgi:GR25 family glycosyltransferase involved in LPS biosynthesis
MTNGMGTRYLLNGDKQPYHEYVEQNGATYFSHCMSRGAIGIVLSHLSILQDAWDSEYETIWVMEDDVVPIRDPNLLSEYIDRLDALVGKNGWDVFFTDQDTKNNYGTYVPCTGFGWRPNFHPYNEGRFAERVDISADFRKIGARFGAYSMVLRRSGIKKILNFIKSYQIFLPYDIEFPLPNGIRLFSVREDIVSTQPGAISDNGGPNYLKP